MFNIQAGGEVAFVVAVFMLIVTLVVVGGAILFIASLARPTKSNLKVVDVIEHSDGVIQSVMSDGTNRWKYGVRKEFKENKQEPNEVFYRIKNNEN